VLVGCIANAHHRHRGRLAKAYHVLSEQRLRMLPRDLSLHQPHCHHHEYQRDNGMNWSDVLMIVFSATAANHLGLVAAAESVIRHRLPVLNCPKCAAFWSVIVYGVAVAARPLDACTARNCSLFTIHFYLTLFAAAFLSAWSAIWLDLLMGIIDKLYIKVYDTFYPTTDTTDADALDTTDPVSGVPE
jgi:hypothetical protein